MRVWIIAARDRNNGIAKEGKIPWTSSVDMQHFSSTTRGSGNDAVLMGRITWDSIGRPLPGRLNLVMSRQVEELDGAHLVPCIEAACKLCIEKNIDTLWICGGGQIYDIVLNDYIELLEACVLTTMDGSWDCDTFFPELCGKTWEVQRSFPLGDGQTMVEVYGKRAHSK